MARQQKSGQSGGNPRFVSAGMQWKSGWKTSEMLSELCCVQGFANLSSDPPFFAYYEDVPGPLDIVPASGFFLAAIFGVSTTDDSVIIRQGQVDNEGYEIGFVENTPGESIDIYFSVGDGAALTTVTRTVALYTADQQQLLGPTRFFAIMAAFSPPTAGFPNGVIGLSVYESDTSLVTATAAMSNPYVNSTPGMRVGASYGVNERLVPPNCLAGFVGGTAEFLEDGSGFRLQVATLVRDWADDVQDAQRIVTVANTASVTALVNTNGYRIDLASPRTPAPDPLPDFIGATPLPQVTSPSGEDALIIDCAALRLGPISYPYV